MNTWASSYSRVSKGLDPKHKLSNTTNFFVLVSPAKPRRRRHATHTGFAVFRFWVNGSGVEATSEGQHLSAADDPATNGQHHRGDEETGGFFMGFRSGSVTHGRGSKSTVPFWGRCTTHFSGDWFFTGGTIWILTHGQISVDGSICQGHGRLTKLPTKGTH